MIVHRFITRRSRGVIGLQWPASEEVVRPGRWSAGCIDLLKANQEACQGQSKITEIERGRGARRHAIEPSVDRPSSMDNPPQALSSPPGPRNASMVSKV